MPTKTEKETEKLFADMSNAIRDQDFGKIDELATSPEEEDTSAPDTHADEPEVTEPDNTSEETDTEDDPATADTSGPDTDDSNDDGAPEPNPEDKLTEALALIEKVKKENHNLRSQAGRVPHLQRQVQQFDKKLEELRELATSPSSRPSAKLSEKINPKLSKIREADPELADILADILAEATDGVAEDLRRAEIESLQGQRQAAAEEYRQAEITRLLEMYPNAGDVFKSPSWKQWEEKQTDRVRALANSDNADDVAFAFERYADDMRKLYPELAGNGEAAKAAPAPDDKAARIEAERQRKKESSVVVGSPSSAGRQQKPSDDKALFEELSKQIRKEITGN